MILTHPILLILAVCVPSNALTAIIPTSNLTSPIAETDHECIPKRSIFTKVPVLEDCQAAISRLPSIEAFGSFHNGPPDDIYKLPVENTAGTCTVSVELKHQGSSREVFSWLYLVAATYRLTKECLGPYERGVGVVIEFGDHRRIVSIVRYHKDVSDGENIQT